jgi:hypothetical protein
VFIGDPMVSDADYSFNSFLRKLYSKEKVQEYVKMFEESLAVPQKGYVLIAHLSPDSKLATKSLLNHLESHS